MRPSDFISFFALFFSIFATIFSIVIFVKEIHIEEQIQHFHHNNLNITSIVRLDKDIAHLFRTLGMEKNRAERQRSNGDKVALQINANASSNFTEGKRGPTKTPSRIFSENATSGKPFNASTEQD